MNNKDTWNLALSIAAPVLAIIVALTLFFTKPEPKPPTPVEQANLTEAKLPEGSVQYANALPNAGAGGGAGFGGGAPGGGAAFGGPSMSGPSLSGASGMGGGARSGPPGGGAPFGAPGGGGFQPGPQKSPGGAMGK